jgi:hypothetical protein
MNAYGLTFQNECEQLTCTVCQRTFFVSRAGVSAKDEESIRKIVAKEVAKEQAHGREIFIAFIAFFPALIATGLIVIIVILALLLLGHLEVSGTLKLPDSVAELAVIAITGLFFFIWRLSFSIVKSKWPSHQQVKDGSCLGP